MKAFESWQATNYYEPLKLKAHQVLGRSAISLRNLQSDPHVNGILTKEKKNKFKLLRFIKKLSVVDEQNILRISLKRKLFHFLISSLGKWWFVSRAKWSELKLNSSANCCSAKSTLNFLFNGAIWGRHELVEMEKLKKLFIDSLTFSFDDLMDPLRSLFRYEPNLINCYLHSRSVAEKSWKLINKKLMNTQLSREIYLPTIRIFNNHFVGRRAM